MGRPKKKSEPLEELLEETTDEMPPSMMDDEDRADMELALSDYIPLFPDADKPQSKTPANVVVHMLHPVNGMEYKGKLPPNATEDAIYQQWGNGTFNLALVDENNRFIRRRNGIKISMNTPRALSESTSLAPAHNGIDANAIREILREERERALQVIKADREAMSQRSGEDRHRADSFLALVTESRKTEAEQTRAFFQAQQQASQESFKQILMIMSTSHAQQMQLMQASAGKPNEQLQTFLAGLQFAQGIDMDDEEKPDPMMGLLAGGLQMFGQVAGAAKAKQLPAKRKGLAATNPAPNPSAYSYPIPQPAPLVTEAPPVIPPMHELEAPKKKGSLTDEEIEGIKVLKILSAQKGISMAELLKLGADNIDQLATLLPSQQAPDSDEDEEEVDEEGNPLQDTTESDASDENADSMDDEESSDEERSV